MADEPMGLETSGFRAYLTTQFLGAFNDNAFKFAILSLITFQTAGDLASEGRLFFLAQALFAVPFVIFATWSGAVADRYAKSSVMVAAKAGEIMFMALAIVAFAVAGLTGLLVVLFFMSVQSTVFGPAKYGFLGEQVAEDRLSTANGWVSMTTFGAIVLGQVTGGGVFEAFEGRLDIGGTIFVVIAVAGLITSLRIPRAVAARPGQRVFANPLPNLRETFRLVAADRTLLYTVGGMWHFSLLAATLQVNLLTYGQTILGLQEAAASTFVATTVVGIAVGSLLAGYWSAGRIELGLVPLGALSMSFGILTLAVLGGRHDAGGLTGVLNVVLPYACVLLLGASGGLFYVPLQAMLQYRAPARDKGRFLAFGNLVFFIGVFMSSVLIWLPRELGLGPRGQAVVVGLISLIGTVLSFRLLPLAFARFCAWLMARTIWRIRVVGEEHLPEEGGALIVANHVSWIDWLVLVATTRRNMSFLIHREYFQWKSVGWLFRLAGCIPVAAGDPREKLDASLAAAGRKIEEGHLVVIFVEGALTRTGNLLSVRRGYSRIVGGRDVPIVPAHLDGLWQSVFSASGGRFFWKLPRRFRHPVTVTYGEPLPSDAEPWRVRYAIQHLSTQAWDHRRADMSPLHVRLLAAARRDRKATLFEPDQAPRSVARLLAESLALRDGLAGKLGTGPRVGILMDRGLDAARTILAVLYAGRVPVPLDVSQSAHALANLFARYPLGTVLTTPRYTDLVKGQDVVDVEEQLGRLAPEALRRWRRRLFWMPRRQLLALALPTGVPDMTDPATVIFSTGATGEPKGIVLSHFNVTAQVDSLDEVLDPTPDDVLLGGQPFSQAFGFTVLLWFPLLTGHPVVWHPSPRDAHAVGKSVLRHGVTMLAASPRHLELWLEGARPEHMGSVRWVLGVGGPLAPSLLRGFLDRFGVEPVESYTATECGPLVALNTPDIRDIGVFQRGSKPGTVGHPLPGVTLEVVDPVSGALRPHDEVGMLRVRSPGVMSGYLDDAERTATVLRDGAYVSGDLGSVDRDGFVTVVGRSTLVDGQAIPLQAVERALHAALGTVECPMAVLPLVTEQRLLVVYEDGCLDPEAIVAALDAGGVPEPWRPTVDDFVAVDELPLTAAGLVDNQALRALLHPPPPAASP